MRPGTGNRGMLASSSGRPGTGRLGTGQKPATPGQTAGYGVSLNTEVNVADRPVTQQGMMGMRIATAGPGRQVQDASYYMGRLHQKTADIKAEIQRISQEIERDTKDKSQYSLLERKYEVLIGDVRKLECQLADYNLATDNLRSSTDPSDIQEVQQQLRDRNRKESEEVDKIFMIRQEKEQYVHKLEKEIFDIQRQHEDRINQLAPEKLQQYQQLLHENQQLEGELGPKVQELDMLIQQIRQKEDALASDRWREECLKLERQIAQLRKERDSAQEDAKAAQMDPEEARALMLAKVKEGKAQMANVEEQLTEVKEELDQLEKAHADLKTDLEERKSESGGSQKYERLFQRDQEMTEFIESFEQKKPHELQLQRETQDTIVALLEHISLGLQREENMPNADKFQEMQDDLSFKEKHLESSKTTKERLEQELAKRHQELEKINTLDDKISVEMTSLREKMEMMNSDMIAFKKVDELKQTAESTKQSLQKLKQSYLRRRDAIKQQVQLLIQDYEQKKNQAGTNDTAKSLEALEQKLRHYEQNIFHLKQFIAQRNREINYGHVKEECLRLVEEANTAIIKNQSVNLNVGMNPASY